MHEGARLQLACLRGPEQRKSYSVLSLISLSSVRTLWDQATLEPPARMPVAGSESAGAARALRASRNSLHMGVVKAREYVSLYKMGFVHYAIMLRVRETACP